MAPARGHILILFVLLTTAIPCLAVPRQCTWDPKAIFGRGYCRLVVDDTSDGGQLLSSPWTHQPFCIPKPATASGGKLCVYTSTTFNDNTGLSLIATPEAAARLAGRSAVESDVLTWKYRRFINYRGRPSASSGRVPYKIEHIPGKGSGMVATSAIKTGQIFMVGFPAIIADNDLFPSLFDGGEPPAEAPRLFQRGLARLTDGERVTQLAQSWDTRDLHIVDDVIRTNAFGVEIDGRGHKGLYPEIARMNHGCDPNAVLRFNPRTLSMEARASRDIELGDELLISYIPLGLPQKHRTKGLRNWGFECTCSLCTGPASVRKSSDTRRYRLVEIRRAIRSVESGELMLKLDDIHKMSEEIVQIAEAERLTTMMVEIYQDLTRLWYGIGDLNMALKYARPAVEFYQKFGDVESEFFVGLKRILRELEQRVQTS